MKKVILPAVLMVLAANANAQKMYKVDSSYGTNGISLTTPSSSSTIRHIEMNTVHLQDDGKVWEGGRVFFAGDSYWSTTIQKRTADATRDVSYSGDGVKISEYQTGNQVVAIMPLKGDKMYAAVTGYGGYVARPDTAMISQVYHGMVLSPSDKINTALRYNDSMVLSAGYAELVWYKDNGLGTGTNNYANSGYTTSARTYIGSEYYYHNQFSMLVQPDGKYLVAGRLETDFDVSSTYSRYAFIARYKAGFNFELDSTFGTNGVQLITAPGTSNGTPYVACIALEPSGSIIANVVGADSATKVAFGQQGMRFNANGTFRENFALPNARKLIVNSDGKIFALGNTGSVFCVNPDGSFYTNFFGGAKALDMAEFPSGAVGHLGRDMSMNADGDIVIVGYYNQGSTGTHSFTRKFKAYTAPSSIKNIAAQNSVNLYPNPNNGVFAIQSETNAEVIISNALGQVISTQKIIKGTQELNISNVANGIYFVKIITDDQQQVIRIVKQ